MDIEVKIREREASLVLSRRVSVTVPEIPSALSTSLGSVYHHLAERAIPQAGAPFVIYHGTPGPGGEPFDIEICAPIRVAAEAPEGWLLRELPAGTFASVIHAGPYERLGETYDAVFRWIPEHDLVIAGPPREVYLTGPEVSPADMRTVIELPVTPSLAMAGATR